MSAELQAPDGAAIISHQTRSGKLREKKSGLKESQHTHKQPTSTQNKHI